MDEIEKKLSAAGYYVANIDYPSTQHPITELAEIAVNEGLYRCKTQGASPLHFVTHSLGGILVRQYYNNHSPDNLKRVVMLGPPNQGSEVVDKLKNVPGFELLNGPAGMQLGTHAFDTPKNLGPVNFELGVIAGTRSINLLLSGFLPNTDDGKVSVQGTKVEGMCGFIAMAVNHPFMMKDDEVIGEVSHFLNHGKFHHKKAIVNPVNSDPAVQGFCTKLAAIKASNT
ncbi:hypothetical protein A9Q89_02940 [Gammaproteobacteria bacterium 53_120_T64]|nr:hypothetical protein A9Q89_02940 [Gammaproteobacteria bacterium 53_120_T64]